MYRHTFRDISLFVAAYEERSFTLAAERENATQSGVSQHIRKLEEGFQVKLFDRQGNKVLPTPAGDLYYQHCITILHSSSEAEAGLARHSSGSPGQLNVGLMPTVTRFCLSRPLHRIVGENPNARIRITEGFSADLSGRVASGELDFAIVPHITPIPGLKFTDFFVTPERFACGPQSPLFLRERITTDDLQGLRIVVPTTANVRRLHIEAWLTIHRVKPSQLMELDSMMGTLDLVRTSDFVAILPGLILIRELKARAAVENLYVPSVQPINTGTKLVVLERSRDSMSHLGETFLRLLAEECRALSQQAGLAG